MNRAVVAAVAAVLLAGCAKRAGGGGPVGPVVGGTEYSSLPGLGADEGVRIIVVNGCEYVEIRADRGVALAHCGVCSNPRHLTRRF